jgi:hypothetical protein
MKNTFQKSKYSVDQLQARKNFENAIVSCPEKLEKMMRLMFLVGDLDFSEDRAMI